MTALWMLLLIGGLILFWVDSLRARERAVAVCANACRQMEVQFLDQTVAISRLGLGRGGRGWLSLRRTYGFEFSTDGTDRWKGRAVLLGKRVESVQMEGAEGVTILQHRSGSR